LSPQPLDEAVTVEGTVVIGGGEDRVGASALDAPARGQDLLAIGDHICALLTVSVRSQHIRSHQEEDAHYRQPDLPAAFVEDGNLDSEGLGTATNDSQDDRSHACGE
jgi:hypothetical protein